MTVLKDEEEMPDWVSPLCLYKINEIATMYTMYSMFHNLITLAYKLFNIVL